MHEAQHAQELGNHKVRCLLCPHHCLLTPNKRGICLTRQNVNGKLVSLNYCSPVSLAIDPIEKKPLYHFYPGSQIFSTGPNGCTLKCTFCQNCEISQSLLPTREVSPKALAEKIISSKTIGVAYTYSEPYIWFETIIDVGSRIKAEGMVNAMVTNGYMEPKPLEQLVEVVDAMNIDIKSMRPEFYRTLCKAQLEPVLRTCETVKKHCHLEITNLLISGENDSDDDVRDLVAYIAANLGKDTPLHISRYFPRHRMTAPPTPRERLLRASEIARESLDYVYLGNIDAGTGANTYCPKCSTPLISREGYYTRIEESLQRDGDVSCRKCGLRLNIVVGSAGE